MDSENCRRKGDLRSRLRDSPTKFFLVKEVQRWGQGLDAQSSWTAVGVLKPGLQTGVTEKQGGFSEISQEH